MHLNYDWFYWDKKVVVIVQKANKNKSCSGVNCTIIVGKYLSIVTASINQYNFFQNFYSTSHYWVVRIWNTDWLFYWCCILQSIRRVGSHPTCLAQVQLDPNSQSKCFNPALKVNILFLFIYKFTKFTKYPFPFKISKPPTFVKLTAYIKCGIVSITFLALLVMN